MMDVCESDDDDDGAYHDGTERADMQKVWDLRVLR